MDVQLSFGGSSYSLSAYISRLFTIGIPKARSQIEVRLKSNVDRAPVELSLSQNYKLAIHLSLPKNSELSCLRPKL